MSARPRLRVPAVALLVCALTGCEHHFFSVHGRIASDGGGLGTWHTSPLGCTRDPQDGAQRGQPTSTIAEFLWRDPGTKDDPPDPMPEEPLRLILSHTGDGRYAGTLRLTQHAGDVPLDSKVCARLEVETHEIAPQIKGSDPGLAGRVQLDCRAEGSHLTADLRFSGCEY